jgi:hypothetical protein
MDVFLVPVGAEAYELYCEHVDEPEEGSEEPPASFFARMKHRFHEMLVEAERERRQGFVISGGGWAGRVRRRAMRWVAESIAEQRLLWNLRRHPTATLHFPNDMAADAAMGVMRQQLGRDFEKHQFWLVIDSLLMIASGLLILVPGPNIIGYYFAFRVVGHFFSLRGAKNGLGRVAWTGCQSAPLTELRRALSLDAEGRLRSAEDVASRLQLDHLATFFQRTAVS